MMMLRIGCQRRTIALGFLMAGIAGAVLLAARHARAEAPATKPVTALAALREQRIVTLRAAADMAKQMYEQGILTLADVLRIDRSLLEAQLESAANDAARVELLTKAVAVAKQQEDLVSQQMRAGAATPLAALEATAERLRVEAQVAELKGK